MGTLLYWRCRGCGASELMCTGRKAGEIDLAPYADAVRQGDLSPPPKALADTRYEISEEYVTYLCPACSKPILGTCLLICIGGAVRSRVYARPRPCPSCGRMPHPWDRHAMLDARGIHARLNRLLQRGCPECGRMGVKHVLVNFGGELTLNIGRNGAGRRNAV